MTSLRGSARPDARARTHVHPAVVVDGVQRTWRPSYTGADGERIDNTRNSQTLVEVDEDALVREVLLRKEGTRDEPELVAQRAKYRLGRLASIEQREWMEATLDARTTMAFWTVLRVTSLPLFCTSSDAIWRLHEMPKTVDVGETSHSKWKYE